MYKELRQYLGEVFHELARHRACKIEEGHLCPDHIPMLISILPKYSVSQVMGYVNGKSVIAIARRYGGTRHFCYMASPSGNFPDAVHGKDAACLTTIARQAAPKSSSLCGRRLTYFKETNLTSMEQMKSRLKSQGGNS